MLRALGVQHLYGYVPCTPDCLPRLRSTLHSTGLHGPCSRSRRPTGGPGEPCSDAGCHTNQREEPPVVGGENLAKGDQPKFRIGQNVVLESTGDVVKILAIRSSRFERYIYTIDWYGTHIEVRETLLVRR